MDIQETRRRKLRTWLQNRTAPTKEKSYFSQLLAGTSPFGERAARRIEREYGMGAGYLDLPASDVSSEKPAEAQTSLATEELGPHIAEIVAALKDVDEEGQIRAKRAVRQELILYYKELEQLNELSRTFSPTRRA